MKVKILITGGSGFIGTNLIDYFLSNSDCDILNIDIKPPRKLDHKIYWREADIRDFKAMKELTLLFRPDHVVHLAARADLTGKSLEDYSTNTAGVRNVIEICNEVPSIKKVIFTSTQLVCKAGYIPRSDEDYCPPNFYGESKMIGEQLVRNAALQLKYNWIIIRPTSIWGPWFGPTYRKFFEMIIKRKYFNFTGRMSTKTYGYVGNSVYQIVELLNADSNNQMTFYIGDYIPVNIKEWATEIATELNYKLVTFPRPLVWLASKVGDLLNLFKIKFPINTFRYKNMTTDNIAPLEGVKHYAPETIFGRSEGIKNTIKWMQEYYL